MATAAQLKIPADAEKTADEISLKEALAKFGSDLERGLSQAEADRRRDQYGPNAIEEKRTSPLVRFLAFFWGPIPILFALALTIVAGASGRNGLVGPARRTRADL